MGVRDCTATILLIITMGCMCAVTASTEATVERYFLEKAGGLIQVETTQPGDNKTRDAVREQLQEEIRHGFSSATPAMRRYEKQIQYRFEKTGRGGEIHITARSREALLAVQDFLRSRMTKPGTGAGVVFDYIPETSLIAVPVMINDHGPYKFLLDTGANKTILSSEVANSLDLPIGRLATLLSAGGNLRVSVRMIDTLRLGMTSVENVDIAVGNFTLMKTLRVDGLLGGDYLRLFKISIDYDNMIVDIQPCCSDKVSLRT